MTKITPFLATVVLLLTALAPIAAAERSVLRGFVSEEMDRILTVTVIETASRASAQSMVFDYDPGDEFNTHGSELDPVSEDDLRFYGVDAARAFVVARFDLLPPRFGSMVIAADDRTVTIVFYMSNDLEPELFFDDLAPEAIRSGTAFKPPRGFTEVDLDDIDNAVPNVPPVPVSSPVSGDVVISGTGSTVTEDFYLYAGRYEVIFTVSSGRCGIIHLYGPSDTKEHLFNECISSGNGFSVAVVYVAPESGMYLIDSQNTESDWIVTFRER